MLYTAGNNTSSKLQSHLCAHQNLVKLTVQRGMIVDCLPKCMALLFCNDWLTIKDVGYLDCATCNSYERPRFLILLVDMKVSGWSKPNLKHMYYAWLFERKLKGYDLTMRRDFSVFESKYTFFGCPKYLTSVDIDDVPWKTERGVDIAIKLTNLKLYTCIGAEILLWIADRCPKLQNICFKFQTTNRHIANSELIYLAKSCHALRSVRLNNVNISPRCFQAFIVSCPELCDFCVVFKGIESIQLTEERRYFSAVFGFHVAPLCIKIDHVEKLSGGYETQKIMKISRGYEGPKYAQRLAQGVPIHALLKGDSKIEVKVWWIGLTDCAMGQMLKLLDRIKLYPGTMAQKW